MSYTLPIYWGTSTISNFFNKKGIIFFETKEELNEILNNLTEDDYYSRLAAIKENYEIASKNYGFWYDRVNEQILSL
jgi:hypothetical protein